jgi:tetratricopeptide (TPR) repeat protein
LKGWHRLGNLLIKLGEFNKAQQVFEVLLDQASDEGEEAHLYSCFGSVKHSQGEYSKAIMFYEKSIRIKRKIFSPTHFELATPYENIGLV